MSGEAVLSRRSGLSVVRDVILAPRSAFEAMRDRTHWGWAFLIVCILGCTGAFLQVPAGEHVATVVFAQKAAHDPAFAGMSQEKQQQILSYSLKAQSFAWAFYPFIALIAIAAATVIMLIGNAVAKGSASFSRLFGLAANVAIINFGISYLLIGALATLRGPDSFSSQRDLIGAIPSLAWVAPGGSAKLAALLAQINPFQIWSFLLLALGLTIIAKLPRTPAYVIAAIVTFGSAIISVPLAQ